MEGCKGMQWERARSEREREREREAKAVGRAVGTCSGRSQRDTRTAKGVKRDDTQAETRQIDKHTLDRAADGQRLTETRQTDS